MKVILNILTHGDEKIGLGVIKEIQKLNIDKKKLTIQIANKEAFKAKKRFIDQDLNRSFPGKKNGNHEEKLAYKLSPYIKSADIVIDVHSTKSGIKNSIIVTKFNNTIREYMKIIKPKYVLIMNATKNTALISQAKIGIAFEYGKDTDSNTLKKIVRDISELFKSINLIDGKVHNRKRITKYFDVYSVVNKPKGYRLLKKIKNYRLVRKGEVFAVRDKDHIVAEKDFYPILFSNDGYHRIFGFKGKEINIKK